MTRHIIAGTAENKNHQVNNGTDYIRFAPQTDKTILNEIIDADAYQDQQLILMKRDRAAILDADAQQAEAHELRPRAQPEDIVA